PTILNIIPPMSNAEILLLQILPGIFIGGYFSTFAHELGHALMGKWNGYDVTSFGMGLARPLLVFTWRGTRVYACWKNYDRGLTFAVYLQPYPTKAQQIAFLSGGLVVHVLLTLANLVLWLWLDWGGAFWATVACVNGYMLVASLIPH